VIGLSAAPLDAAALVRAVQSPAHGAVVTFLGTTRETSPDDPRPVAALEYEAYDAMAQPEMEAIAREACERFGPLEIAMAHRTGTVALGEPSVVVVVAAPHRGPAFEACRYAIDALKARVPVWKREIYRDGGAAWVANEVTSQGAPSGHPDGTTSVSAPAMGGTRAAGVGGAEPGAERR
jgi:molybdopterin synthase catalytic subunit